MAEITPGPGAPLSPDTICCHWAGGRRRRRLTRTACPPYRAGDRELLRSSALFQAAAAEGLVEADGVADVVPPQFQQTQLGGIGLALGVE